MRLAALLASIAAAAACAAGADTGNAYHVDPAGCGTIQTANQTPKWAWITIYDAAETRHLDYGWVAPFAVRAWRSGQYSCAGLYHVRGELKDAGGPNPPGDIPNIFDTRVQVTFDQHDVYLQMPIAIALTDTDPTRWTYKTAPWRFWWSHRPAPDVAPDLITELPKVHFTSTAEVPVHVQFTGNGDDVQGCVQPYGPPLTLTIPNPGPYTFSWTLASCKASSLTVRVQKNLAYAGNNIAFGTALVAKAQYKSGGNLANIVVNNRLPLVASISLSGNKPVCIGASATASLASVPGQQALVPTVGTTCAGTDRIALRQLNPILAAGYTYVFDIDPGPH
jgi:hypothetical protein